MSFKLLMAMHLVSRNVRQGEDRVHKGDEFATAAHETMEFVLVHVSSQHFLPVELAAEQL